jgi:hypothetical protein
MFSPNGLRPHVLNWTQTRAALLKRLRREATATSDQLRRQFDNDAPASGDKIALSHEPTDPLLSLELRVGDHRLRLFNMFTTFGTPQDVLLQELRIDMSFPADEATRRFLNEAAQCEIGAAPNIRQDA